MCFNQQREYKDLLAENGNFTQLFGTPPPSPIIRPNHFRRSGYSISSDHLITNGERGRSTSTTSNRLGSELERNNSFLSISSEKLPNSNSRRGSIASAEYSPPSSPKPKKVVGSLRRSQTVQEGIGAGKYERKRQAQEKGAGSNVIDIALPVRSLEKPKDTSTETVAATKTVLASLVNTDTGKEDSSTNLSEQDAVAAEASLVNLNSEEAQIPNVTNQEDTDEVDNAIQQSSDAKGKNEHDEVASIQITPSSSPPIPRSNKSYDGKMKLSKTRFRGPKSRLKDNISDSDHLTAESGESSEVEERGDLHKSPEILEEAKEKEEVHSEEILNNDTNMKELPDQETAVAEDKELNRDEISNEITEEKIDAEKPTLVDIENQIKNASDSSDNQHDATNDVAKEKLEGMVIDDDNKKDTEVHILEVKRENEGIEDKDKDQTEKTNELDNDEECSNADGINKGVEHSDNKEEDASENVSTTTDNNMETLMTQNANDAKIDQIPDDKIGENVEIPSNVETECAEAEKEERDPKVSEEKAPVEINEEPIISAEMTSAVESINIDNFKFDDDHANESLHEQPNLTQRESPCGIVIPNEESSSAETEFIAIAPPPDFADNNDDNDDDDVFEQQLPDIKDTDNVVIPSSINQSDDSPGDCFKDSPEDCPKNPPEDCPKDSPEDYSKDSPEDSYKDSPEDYPKDSPEDCPKDSPEDCPDEVEVTDDHSEQIVANNKNSVYEQLDTNDEENNPMADIETDIANTSEIPSNNSDNATNENPVLDDDNSLPPLSPKQNYLQAPSRKGHRNRSKPIDQSMLQMKDGVELSALQLKLQKLGVTRNPVKMAQAKRLYLRTLSLSAQ